MRLQNEIMKTVANGNRKKTPTPFGRVLAGCAILLSVQAGNASAKEAAPESIWAKAGVTYEQYRGDALECGKKGLARNVANSEEVKTLARASKQLEALDASAQATVPAAGPMGQPDLSGAMSRSADEQRVIAAARPAQQYAGIKEMMFQDVRRCMIDRGYAKIVLTDAQRKDYDGIKGGADARRAYIHKLASDPRVLETQREATGR